MVTTTYTEVLNLFSRLRDLLLANSTISSKFNKDDFYEFDPKLKSSIFKGFPYINIEIPDLKDDKEYIGKGIDELSLEVTITMVNEYSARDNVSTYAGAILKVFTDTTQSDAFYFNKIKMNKPEPMTKNQKEVIVTEFKLDIKVEVETA